MTERPPEGTRVWVSMAATVKPDRWQAEVEDDQTSIEIDGGWTYDWDTDALRLAEPGEVLGYIIVEPGPSPLKYAADWDGEIHQSLEEAWHELHRANNVGREDEHADFFLSELRRLK